MKICVAHRFQLNWLDSHSSIRSHFHHWFCCSVAICFFFLVASSIKFIIVFLQKFRIPRHLDISVPLFTYSVPLEIFVALEFQERCYTTDEESYPYHFKARITNLNFCNIIEAYVSALISPRVGQKMSKKCQTCQKEV